MTILCYTIPNYATLLYTIISIRVHYVSGCASWCEKCSVQSECDNNGCVAKSTGQGTVYSGEDRTCKGKMHVTCTRLFIWNFTSFLSLLLQSGWEQQKDKNLEFHVLKNWSHLQKSINNRLGMQHGHFILEYIVIQYLLTLASILPMNKILPFQDFAVSTHLTI